jgi:hypothetical protein
MLTDDNFWALMRGLMGAFFVGGLFVGVFAFGMGYTLGRIVRPGKDKGKSRVIQRTEEQEAQMEDEAHFQKRAFNFRETGTDE